MFRLRTRGVVVLATTLLTIQIASAQAVLNDASLRPLLRSAVSAAAGSPKIATDTLDKAVRAAFGDLETGPVLFTGADGYAALITPYVAVRQDLQDRVADFESIDDLTLPDFVSIMSHPQTVNHPDITRVVVTRDGKPVEPSSNTLTVQPFVTTQGASFKRHAGYVDYPLSAFKPGATVVITLVPASGKNVDLKLDAKALAKLK